MAEHAKFNLLTYLLQDIDEKLSRKKSSRNQVWKSVAHVIISAGKLMSTQDSANTVMCKYENT